MKKVSWGLAIISIVAVGLADARAATVQVLVVGGGGGGGSSGRCGGGGGGGGVVSTSLELAPGNYSISVGGGGGADQNGGNTTGLGLTAVGGGKGGNGGVGAAGGCGGGGGGSGDHAGGNGSQGGKGGTSYYVYGGGGGGGAAPANGTNAGDHDGGNGGAGYSSSITGSAVVYGSGGGGGANNSSQNGIGGSGAGHGGTRGGAAAGSGVANRGGGGGGRGYDGSNTGSGGSGVFIIRYKTTDWGTCTGGTITTVGSDTVHRFTSNGTFTAVAANDPPTAFSLLAPADQTATSNNMPQFSWGEASDPDDPPLPISYTLKIGHDAQFSSVYREVSGISTESYTPTTPIDDGNYYWKVTASDGELTTDSTQTWGLTVDTVLPPVPVLTGMTTDFVTGTIAGILGTAESGSSLTFYGWDAGAEDYVTIAGTTGWDGNAFSFDPDVDIESGRMVYVVSHDAALNPAQSRVSTMSFDHHLDVFQDRTVDVSGGAGSSLRLAKDTTYSFKIAVNGNQAVTVSAYLRSNAAYDGTAPSITLTGLGITGEGFATASLTAAAETWQQLTVTGTPNAAGILTLTFQTFSTAEGANAWIDDISVSQ